ncbi:hypothetical protein CEXT_628901 [Caerostris extrusa]|uniref:Uncharacterized protein n=1 Tax=Caerostris extrusa TaxID=172846 RepID=A0AAV4NBA9_CAEEX|nr:hypothetical protein CEXT_628901 [Caerostris extrusa]
MNTLLHHQSEMRVQLHPKELPDVSNDLSPTPTPGNYSSYRLSPQMEENHLFENYCSNPISSRLLQQNAARDH